MKRIKNFTIERPSRYIDIWFYHLLRIVFSDVSIDCPRPYPLNNELRRQHKATVSRKMREKKFHEMIAWYSIHNFAGGELHYENNF